MNYTNQDIIAHLQESVGAIANAGALLIASQAAEIERLNGAVQRTADGVIPTVSVWYPGAVEVHHGFVQHARAKVMLGSGDILVAIGLCYSTPELAESARSAGFRPLTNETQQKGGM